MQPGMLSLEPLVLLSIAFFFVMALPLLGLVIYQASPIKRLIFALPCILAFCGYSLWLGQAMGRSKAWYHWRTEYQQPLWNLHYFISESYSNKNPIALDEFHRRFAAENVQAYGREILFERGPFSTFVQNLTESTNQVQKPL